VTSLRRGVLLGATIWSVGLLGIWGTALTFYARKFPRMYVIHAYPHAMMCGAAVAMAIGFWCMRNALAPLKELRERLADVEKGANRQLEGRYPAEVQPLVTDLNALLAHRDEAVRRALAKAGDLAHGLKTPLAVLSQEAERAGADGRDDLASALGEQVERMRRQIDYHLAHARAAASGATPGARCAVRSSADALARTLLRLHAGRGITIDVCVAEDHAVRCHREDLDEMLGNLLDNACKWGRRQIAVTSERQGAVMLIRVDDDGAGLDPAMREAVLQRGVRADEAAPGFGFGLAIVRELSELYGGSIALDRSPARGLGAHLRLPAA
jgi:signal transduction histidine kinase